MNLKKMYILALLAGILSLSACGKQANTVAREADTKANDNNSSLVFPETFVKTVDNVKYDLNPEIPENMDINNMHQVEVQRIMNNDAPASFDILGKDKVIAESHTSPAEQYVPEEYSYLFEDGTVLNTGGNSISYDSPYSYFYTRVFSRISNEPAYQEQKVADFPFATAAECIEKLTDIMAVAGFKTTFSASVFALPAEQAKNWEEHTTIDGNIQLDKYKDTWTDEDNAYLISAYQTYNELPVFNEMLAMNQRMAMDVPDNAPIQAIYTARGLESLFVMTQYEFKETDKAISMLPFETITETISSKFNSILSEAPYEVYKAKLFLMVRHINAQDYEAFPVWYFEASEEGSDENSVLLVDAVTGKEINIG